MLSKIFNQLYRIVQTRITVMRLGGEIKYNFYLKNSTYWRILADHVQVLVVWSSIKHAPHDHDHDYYP